MKIKSKRAQMYFPPDLYLHLSQFAKKNGKNISEVVRESVEKYLNDSEEKKQPNDSINDIIGMFESKDGDLSINHDKYLYGIQK